MKCAHCMFDAKNGAELAQHDKEKHREKLPEHLKILGRAVDKLDGKIDPGNEFSGPSNKKLDDLINWIRRQPDANLRTGEAKLLLDEIDRLNEIITNLQKTGARV